MQSVYICLRVHMCISVWLQKMNHTHIHIQTSHWGDDTHIWARALRLHETAVSIHRGSRIQQHPVGSKFDQPASELLNAAFIPCKYHNVLRLLGATRALRTSDVLFIASTFKFSHSLQQREVTQTADGARCTCTRFTGQFMTLSGVWESCTCARSMLYHLPGTGRWLSAAPCSW